jgi:prepilin-type N-terminal cleavage/methylation domain-containing protein
MNPRRGVTLVELLVALAILGLMTGVVVLQAKPARLARSDWRSDSVATLRRRAVTQGRAQTAILVIDSARAYPLTALPDGRVVADSVMDVDAFTGRRREAR